MDKTVVTAKIEREEKYRFRIKFGQSGVPDLISDEPPPLGSGEGPNPSGLLSAAVGGCLTASLLFCLEKSKIPVAGLESEVTATISREPKGRLRVTSMQVKISTGIAEADRSRAQRCIQIFEDYCTVTQSIRQGIDIKVDVDAGK